MSNGTSLSFLVYMIYNKSIWKYKGEESGYMEKAMEKIKNMKNGTASEKQYRVRRCRYTDLAMFPYSVSRGWNMQGKDIFKAGTGIR